MRWRAGVLVAVCLMGLAGLALASPAAGASDGPVLAAGQQFESPHTGVLADEHVGSCAATPPEDHADPGENSSEVVGWVDGYWYDEPVAVTPEDGFNQSELERLTKRTAARVEALRCLTFESIPPLETVARDEYRSDVEESFNDQVTAEGELYENAQFAARLTVGTEEDAIREQIDAQTALPAAFYDTEEEYMAFVTDTNTVDNLSQPILAHELTHALQDQYFNLSEVFAEPTNDRYLSSAGIVEGDADLVESFYRDNCESGWSDECIIPEQGAPPDIPNWGIFMNQLSVYNFPLVEQTYDSAGLEGVNDLFGNWPNTTAEAINPGQYGQFDTAETTVADQSSTDWRRVESGNQTVNTVGQAGLTAMFVAPAFEAPGIPGVIDDIRGFQEGPGEFNYGITETQGWRGDSLYGYANDENETGAVWHLAWENDEAAAEFAETYESLIEFRDGAPADDYQNVYTFDDSDAYEMAVGLEQNDDRVLIVTAPSVEELTAVHEGLELQDASSDEDETNDENDNDSGQDSEESDEGADETDENSGGETDESSDDEMGENSDDEMTDGEDASDDEESGDESEDGESGDDDGAGFGLVVALLAVVSVALAGWSRHR